MKKYISIFIIIVIFVTCFSSCGLADNKRKLINITPMNQSHQLQPISNNDIIMSKSKPFDGISIETILDVNKKITAFLPNTPNDTVNSNIKSFYDSIIENHNAKKTIRLDFDVYPYNSELWSFMFTTQSNSVDNFISIQTNTFNMKSGNQLTLDDIFEAESPYLNFLSEKSQTFLNSYVSENNTIENEATIKELTLPTQASFQHFLLKNDKFSIVFQINTKNGKKIIPMDIDYKELSDKKFLKNISSEKPIAVPPSQKPNDGSKRVAFTFDDGPSRKYTPKVLDKLSEMNAKATFFVLGSKVKKDDDILKRMIELGCEVGSHSYNHPNLKISPESVINAQINDTNALIEGNTGIPTTLLRPPYGAFTKAQAEKYKMQIIMWSVDPEDWKYRDARTIADNIISKTNNGDIILVHDIYESTYEGFCIAIDELAKQGYSFVTVSEILGLDSSTPAGSIYYNSTNIK